MKISNINSESVDAILKMTKRCLAYTVQNPSGEYDMTQDESSILHWSIIAMEYQFHKSRYLSVDMSFAFLFFAKSSIEFVDIEILEYTLYFSAIEFNNPTSHYYYPKNDVTKNESVLFAILMLTRKMKCGQLDNSMFFQDQLTNKVGVVKSIDILSEYCFRESINRTELIPRFQEYKKAELKALCELKTLGIMKSPGQIVDIILLGNISKHDSQLNPPKTRRMICAIAHMILCSAYTDNDVFVINPVSLACAAIEAAKFLSQFLIFQIKLENVISNFVQYYEKQKDRVASEKDTLLMIKMAGTSLGDSEFLETIRNITQFQLSEIKDEK